MALLDLDRFKQINDTYGHLIGDEVLRQIADTMTAVLREYDVAGRFGGEEFVMLLPQTRAPDAFKIADRVRARIGRMPIVTSSGEKVSVTVSIGVAALDAGSSRELTDLLAAADAALYRAKASGRDQVQMISTSRGLSAVRSPAVNDAPMSATAAALWRPAAPRRTPELAADEFDSAEFDAEFEVPDDGSSSTAPPPPSPSDPRRQRRPPPCGLTPRTALTFYPRPRSRRCHTALLSSL